MSTHILYFAYGSNMAPERLQARTPSARPLGVGTLAGRRLEFRKLSREDGSGKCDVPLSDNPDDRVHGVLYSLHPEELPTLDAYEGVGFGYDRELLEITRSDGETVHAETYVATLTRPGLLPLCWYREHVLRGARHHKLPADYIAAIESIVVQEDPDSIRRNRELAIYSETA